MKADDLLAAIPEEWRDVKRDDLGGYTPREAVEHFNTTGCRGCWFALVGLSGGRNR